MSEKQHDHHCLINVDWTFWRIQWIAGGRMSLGGPDRQERVIDLRGQNWARYCEVAARALERMAQDEAQTERQARAYAHWKEFHDVPWGGEPEDNFTRHVRIRAVDCYLSADELEDEINYELREFTDVESIMGVALERLEWKRSCRT